METKARLGGHARVHGSKSSALVQHHKYLAESYRPGSTPGNRGVERKGSDEQVHRVSSGYTTTSPEEHTMDPSGQFCPNFYCLHRGKPGLGNIRAHSRTEQRYRCTTCGKTFAAT